MTQISMFQFAPQEPRQLPGCSLIYEPKGRAREYAPLACNIYRGCDHGCTYCYGPSTLQVQPAKFVHSAPRPGLLDRLPGEAAKYAKAAIAGPVLLCFTCDPYQHLDVAEGTTRQVILILHAYGLNVHILTKGGSRALRDLDLFGSRDAFATTLTFLDRQQSATWEPHAASPEDRIETMRAFHSAGVPTWVSLEPVIDPAQSLAIIEETHAFVDLYKVGRLNYHPLARSIDWRAFAQCAVALLERLGKPYYVKKDLACFL